MLLTCLVSIADHKRNETLKATFYTAHCEHRYSLKIP